MPVLDLFRLDGKTAVVTGARRGIGRALAVALAEAGADVIGVSASLAPHASEVEDEVRSRGRQFHGYACDFADRDAVYRLIGQLQANHPTIDILVNNAGTTVRAPAAEFRDEDWDTILAVNLTAPFILSRELGKAMIAQGHGKIIFIASLMSFQGGITIPAYTASKGGIGQLTKALANEWAPKNVQVNAIAPGYIATDNTAELQQDPARYPAISARIPAGRWGQPGDLQGAVVFLASGASDYLNGTILTIDGGWLAR